MRPRVLLVVVSLLTACASRSAPVAPRGYADLAAYREARARLITEERAWRLGASLVLTAEEETADRSLIGLKHAELERTRTYFPPAHSFLHDKTKHLIAASPVFDLMQRMPKGAILHAHGGAMGDFRWLIADATYRPDCYIYVGEGPTPVHGALQFFEQPPGEGWRRISDLRAAAPDAKAFDEELALFSFPSFLSTGKRTRASGPS